MRSVVTIIMQVSLIIIKKTNINLLAAIYGSVGHVVTNRYHARRVGYTRLTIANLYLVRLPPVSGCC